MLSDRRPPRTHTVSHCWVLARRQCWVRDNQNDVSQERTGRGPSLAEWTRGGPRGAEPADLLVSRSSGLHRCTSHPAAPPTLGFWGGKKHVSGFQASGAGQRCTVPWMGHLPSVWNGPGGQRPATFGVPLSSFPQGPSPILAFSTWKSLVRKPSVLCMWSAGRLRWCHSPHLAPDRTGDAAFVQGNTDGDFYGGSDRNLRYRFW